jgi:superfamily I DNA/RNA helicase
MEDLPSSYKQTSRALPLSGRQKLEVMTIDEQSSTSAMSDRAELLGSRCERVFRNWLETHGYAVTPLANAKGNSVGTEAPMMLYGSRKYRAPDFDTVKSRAREFWEVKYRSRPFVDPVTGLKEHRIDRECFDDYYAVQELWGATVWIVVYEAATSSTPGRWLRISVDDAMRSGRLALCPSSIDTMVESRLWPVEEMEVLAVPAIDESGSEPPIVSDDEPVPPRPSMRYSPYERRLRERAREAAARGDTAPLAPVAVASGPEQTLAFDPVAALDVLRRDLGIPSLPRYSVMLVGGEGVKIKQVLGLLDYGIRLFLVTASRDEELWRSLRPYEQARLLEWQCVSDLGSDTAWIIDGALSAEQSPWLSKVLGAADELGGVSLQQYKIVHAHPHGDVLVTAGAGTGKTETMTERLVFLMATVHGYNDVRGGSPATPRTMGLDDVGMVTFTREAAREMRRRIARTIMLRQRLCPRCVHPTAAWLMQLGRAQISTIHMFARGLVQQFGSAIGMGPGFKVSSRTMSLKAYLRGELSARLEPLFASAAMEQVPPIHLWLSHTESVWEALENNGVPLLTLGPATGSSLGIDWGAWPDQDVRREAVRIVGEVIEAVARHLGEECVREQFLRTSQLVPAALQAVRATGAESIASRKKRLRFLFVDEFQDTDAMQLELLLAIRQCLDARLFVVGDAKQGIYRFRGASGNAFDALRQQVDTKTMSKFSEFSLTRNFRSDGNLLESMHPYFRSWGILSLLPYGSKDHLLPRNTAARKGNGLVMTRVGKRAECLEYAAALAQRWRQEDPTASIAILCRRNSQAMKVHRLIKDRCGSCALLVGGTFFISEAVLELRALLDAVLDPSNTASLLELCETRWAGAILSDTCPWNLPAACAAWGASAPVPMDWKDRFASLALTSNFDISDLAGLRRRVEFLAARARQMSAVAFIVECHTKIDPSACERVGDGASGASKGDDRAARAAYSRNLDHLITLIDSQFQNSAATVDSILDWLRMQIGTNRNEDEPAEPRSNEGETIALTVHKSKGLEFDRVIVACTDTEYEASSFIKSQAFVTAVNGKTTVWWRWKLDDQGVEWMNAQAHDSGWQVDQRETEREEARLLYVAMTRAKAQLELLRPARACTTPCWDALLGAAEVQR